MWKENSFVKEFEKLEKFVKMGKFVNTTKIRFLKGPSGVLTHDMLFFWETTKIYQKWQKQPKIMKLEKKLLETNEYLYVFGSHL